MNLPNKLTLLRIILVPVFVLLYIRDMYIPAFAAFIIASITDTLDGQIARKRNLVTNFGKIMDPLADKILVYSALCLFIEDGIITAWMMIIILAREFTVAGLRTVAASEGKVIAAGMTGKIKTVLQMVAVPMLILQNFTLIYTLGVFVFYASLLMTVVSGIEYVYKNREVFSM